MIATAAACIGNLNHQVPTLEFEHVHVISRIIQRTLSGPHALRAAALNLRPVHTMRCTRHGGRGQIKDVKDSLEHHA